MEDLVCPECNAPLKEEDLKQSLVCPNCKTNLRDSKYLDFLELLVYYDIIDDIDFFDMSLYGKISDRIKAFLLKWSNSIEQSSIDEFWINIS